MTRTVTVVPLLLALFIVGCKTAPEAPKSENQEAIIQLDRKMELLEQIEKKYENPEAHYQLGKLSYEEGHLDKADFEYHVALGFDPVHYRAQAGLVRVATDQKQADRARIIAELYINQAAVSAPASIRLGKAFQNEGLGDYALSCYYQASGVAPKSPEPYKLIGYHYLEKGDKVRAEENFRRSFELDPYQADVAAELGRLGVVIGSP